MSGGIDWRLVDDELRCLPCTRNEYHARDEARIRQYLAGVDARTNLSTGDAKVSGLAFSGSSVAKMFKNLETRWGYYALDTLVKYHDPSHLSQSGKAYEEDDAYAVTAALHKAASLRSCMAGYAVLASKSIEDKFRYPPVMAYLGVRRVLGPVTQVEYDVFFHDIVHELLARGVPKISSEIDHAVITLRDNHEFYATKRAKTTRTTQKIFSRAAKVVSRAAKLTEQLTDVVEYQLSARSSSAQVADGIAQNQREIVNVLGRLTDALVRTNERHAGYATGVVEIRQILSESEDRRAKDSAVVIGELSSLRRENSRVKGALDSIRQQGVELDHRLTAQGSRNEVLATTLYGQLADVVRAQRDAGAQCARQHGVTREFIEDRVGQSFRRVYHHLQKLNDMARDSQDMMNRMGLMISQRRSAEVAKNVAALGREVADIKNGLIELRMATGDARVFESKLEIAQAQHRAADLAYQISRRIGDLEVRVMSMIPQVAQEPLHRGEVGAVDLSPIYTALADQKGMLTTILGAFEELVQPVERSGIDALLDEFPGDKD